MSCLFGSDLIKYSIRCVFLFFSKQASLKTDKWFKPQLQTIYSMRSEMDMNESMYLSNGNSLSNVGSKSNGSFYNSGSSSSREGLGGGPCAAANGLVPDGVNTSLAPSPPP